MKLYKKALEIATDAHKGQKRNNGDEYITHPIRVANKFEDEELKCVAILHDVIEDTKIEALDLAIHFNEKIISALIAISKHRNENYFDFIMRCNCNKIAKEIKIADIKDNLSDKEEGHAKDKYRLALHILEKERRHE